MSQNCTDALQVNHTVLETLTLGVSSASLQDQFLPAYSFSNGNGSNQVQLHWEAANVTLAASASTTYTLSALTDSLGRTVAFSKVMLMILQVITLTAGDYLTVGAAASHPWTAYLGGTTPTEIVYDLLVRAVAQTDGLTVTSGSSDQLKITNSGSNSITFSIGFVGY